MRAQCDAFGHQGRVVRMADGTLNVYYNGFTQEDLTGRNRGQGGLEALGVENVKPIMTRHPDRYCRLQGHRDTRQPL